MNSLQPLLQKLQGKKTYVGMILLCLLGAVSNGDMMLHDGECRWLSGPVYGLIGTAIAGLTGVFLRLGVSTEATKSREQVARDVTQMLMSIFQGACEAEARKGPGEFATRHENQRDALKPTGLLWTGKNWSDMHAFLYAHGCGSHFVDPATHVLTITRTGETTPITARTGDWVCVTRDEILYTFEGGPSDAWAKIGADQVSDVNSTVEQLRGDLREQS